MATKLKTFDCVEMKREAQERLHAEYDRRRSEFASYVDFLNAKAQESELWKWIREKTTAASSP